VHGAGLTIEMSEASNALYWAMRYLAEPILDFLSAHEDEPIEELEREIAALPTMPGWEARLGPQSLPDRCVRRRVLGRGLHTGAFGVGPDAGGDGRDNAPPSRW